MKYIYYQSTILFLLVALGAYSAEAFTTHRSVVESLGYAVVIALPLALGTYLFLGAQHVKTCSTCQRRFGVTWLANRRRKTRSFKIGGVIYRPSPLTKSTIIALDEVRYIPENGIEAFFGPQTPADHERRLNSLFEELRILLVDADGQHPDRELLEFHIPVPEAVELLDKLGPENRPSTIEEVEAD